MGISIDKLEQAASGGWQAPEVDRLGDWLLRAAEGFTGRANSALTIGDPGLHLPDAIDQVVRWYQARGLPPMASIAFPLGRPQDTPIDVLLAGRDWRIHHDAIVMTAPAAEVASRTSDLEVIVQEAPDEGWLARYRHRGTQPPPISRKLLTSAPWQAFASVRDGAETVAVGRVAISDGWAGLTAVEVHPAHRRRGLGSALTTALAQAAVDQGAAGLYLQVETGNAAARDLYERCGFSDHHGYHYRVSPAADHGYRQPPQA